MRKENITHEVCPHCDREVKLENELKVQKCPKCGKWIVTCSMCFNPEMNYSCKDCCLEILAKKLNQSEENFVD